MDPRVEAGAGRYEIQLIDDPEWWGYWHAYLDDTRINGGLCQGYMHGANLARWAINRAREQYLRENYYWDHETCNWIRKGELPPL